MCVNWLPPLAPGPKRPSPAKDWRPISNAVRQPAQVRLDLCVARPLAAGVRRVTYPMFWNPRTAHEGGRAHWRVVPGPVLGGAPPKIPAVR